MPHYLERSATEIIDCPKMKTPKLGRSLNRSTRLSQSSSCQS